MPERPIPSPTSTGSGSPRRWYTVEEGKEAGPWLEITLRNRIAAGIVSPDVLVWTDGMTGWLPYDQTPESRAAVLLPVSRESTEAPRSDVPKRWHRWFARMIDLYLTVIVLGVLFGALGYTGVLANEAIISMLGLVLLVGLEALLLATVGYTPGKALMNIRVDEHDGRRLTWGRSLRRAGSVWMNGLAMGIPLVYLVAMNRRYKELGKDRITTYDAAGQYRVTHGPVDAPRMIAIVVMATIFIGILALGASAS